MKKRLLLPTLFWGLFSLTLWSQNKVTLLRNPDQQFPITIGLQYQHEAVWGLRLGTDYIYAQKDKLKAPKNGNRKECGL